MNVHTGVSAPTASTESRMSRAPSLSQSIGGVRIVGRLAVAHFAGVERLVAPVGDDLRRPPVSPPDVAEQLLDRPVRTRRNRRGRVGGANQFAECRCLVDERSAEIHVTNLTQ